MSPARKTVATAGGGITLSHAASVLRRTPKVVDSLVRREKIVKPRGRPGRGGEYRVDRDSLLVLDMAARLNELHVPKPAIKRLIDRLRALLDVDGEIALVYTPEGEYVIALDSGLDTLRDLMRGGATVEVVQPKRQQAELREQLALAGEPRRRGRPKLNKALLEKMLTDTAALGDNETSPDELARMIGDRGTPPWRRGS